MNSKVYGVTVFGGIAEFTVMPCSTAALMSNKLNFTQAAALPVAALTSLEALERAEVKKGQKVLIIGASGGCGMFGVMLANLRGAFVTGISSRRNSPFVKSLKADRVVDYSNAVEMGTLSSEGAVYDVIYDTVTSFDPVDPNYIPITKPLLKEGGRYIAINGYQFAWAVCFIDQATRLLFGFTIQRSGYELFFLTPTAEAMQKITRWYDNGDLSQVPLDSIYSLDAAGSKRVFEENVWRAMSRMKSRRAVGKIVFEFSESG